jgi:hypothetical protein
MESTDGETGPATGLVPELNSSGVWPGRLVISRRKQGEILVTGGCKAGCQSPAPCFFAGLLVRYLFGCCSGHVRELPKRYRSGIEQVSKKVPPCCLQRPGLSPRDDGGRIPLFLQQGLYHYLSANSFWKNVCLLVL